MTFEPVKFNGYIKLPKVGRTNPFGVLLLLLLLIYWGGGRIPQGGGGEGYGTGDREHICIHIYIYRYRIFAELPLNSPMFMFLVASGFGGICPHRLQNIQHVASTGYAFAAILGDGTVRSWGHHKFGGDSNKIQEQLKNVQQAPVWILSGSPHKSACL